MKRKLTDTEEKNKNLEEDVKRKSVDLKQTKEELNRQLAKSEQNDQKMSELEREIHRLTQELQVKSLQLNDVKKSANEINGSKCVQLAYAQEEIANLKNEVANILNRQFVLKREVPECITLVFFFVTLLCCRMTILRLKPLSCIAPSAVCTNRTKRSRSSWISTCQESKI